MVRSTRSLPRILTAFSVSHSYSEILHSRRFYIRNQRTCILATNSEFNETSRGSVKCAIIVHVTYVLYICCISKYL